MDNRQAKQVAKDRRAARRLKWTERAVAATWRGASHFVATAATTRDTKHAD